ncbi:hypothetical protein CY34DRAFT_620403 [Suillus luteus UH-Slu-Lm8-n1]|uniref:Uncharacterized protein n=1 Tax=Suillus luteus UH-Slu-Lm8-n1 TaxID=930992 RepID=A0A0D0B3N0_9AGAM|nr:hypothetical protein CY34DRAFT_620403 [Suillus luteus UH-Slu-Lm8-n1]
MIARPGSSCGRIAFREENTGWAGVVVEQSRWVSKQGRPDQVAQQRPTRLQTLHRCVIQWLSLSWLFPGLYLSRFIAADLKMQRWFIPRLAHYP